MNTRQQSQVQFAKLVFARLLLQVYFCKSIIASLSFISFSVYVSAKLAHHLGTNAKWLILQLSRFINIWRKSTDLKYEKACEIENEKWNYVRIHHLHILTILCNNTLALSDHCQYFCKVYESSIKILSRFKPKFLA